MYPLSNRSNERRKFTEVGLNPQQFLADWLQDARESYMQNTALSSETRIELLECLSLAEAAVRRADLELRLKDLHA